MNLSENDFYPITIDDKPLFDAITRQYPIVHSENTFNTLFCWREYGNYSIAYVKDSLIIRGNTKDYTSYRAPLGPRDPEVLDAVLHLAIDSGDSKPFLVFDPSQLSWIQELYPLLTFLPDRNFFDYVYVSNDLALLKGKQYVSIRKQINRFRKKCEPETEYLTDNNYQEVLEFLIKWCQWRECDKYEILKYEKQALICALQNRHELGLQGIIIRTKGLIGGIAIYEELNPLTAVVHFEKGLPDCEGIYKEINQRTAETLFHTYQYINRESDMGIEGLREAKKRYYPHHMVEMYYLQR